MKLKKQKSGLVLIAGAMAFVSPVWALDLKPGQYEITSQVEMPGVPMTMPPQTATQCLTKNDPVPSQAAGGSGECKITDMKTKGNTVMWTMECNEAGHKSVTKGETVYHGDRFDGTITNDMGPESGGMIIIIRVSGKRTGNCR